LKAAELELEHARRNLELTRQLFDKSLASGRQLSTDEFAVKRVEDALRALQEIDATVAGRQLEVLRQRVESSREAAERARVALEQRSVTAPIAGRLMRYTFYPGEIIRPDMVLYEIFDGPVNTMKVRVPERHAAHIHIGQAVQARLGTHRTIFIRRFPGEVAFMRPVVEGDGGDNYRVIYCTLDLEGEDVPPGTSAETRIRIGRSSFWMHVLEL
jgi:multidrug resistance efflux pump